jgi:cobalamin biosynthesis protein CobW
MRQVTGFLGAGKTTLIRHVLENAAGRRLALIINEFGDVGVDGSILKSCGIDTCPEENIVELANGCLCCTVADDFVPAIEALLARSPQPDHIIIETSGLALPKPLVKAFDWPEIRTRLTVDGVIAVVDGAAVAEGRFADDPAKLAAQRIADTAIDHENPLEEVYEDQLLCADLVILNKADLLPRDALDRITTQIRQTVPRAVKIVPTHEARLDPAILLGLSAAAEDDLAQRPSHHDTEEGRPGGPPRRHRRTIRRPADERLRRSHRETDAPPGPRRRPTLPPPVRHPVGPWRHQTQPARDHR